MNTEDKIRTLKRKIKYYEAILETTSKYLIPDLEEKKPPIRKISRSYRFICSSCGKVFSCVDDEVFVDDTQEKHLYYCENPSCLPERILFVRQQIERFRLLLTK